MIIRASRSTNNSAVGTLYARFLSFSSVLPAQAVVNVLYPHSRFRERGPRVDHMSLIRSKEVSLVSALTLVLMYHLPFHLDFML